MAKRNGFFKRMGAPVILTVGRSNQLVKTGDVILADFDSMMDKQGWMFVPRFDPNKEKMQIQQSVVPAQNPSNSMLQITDMKRVEMQRAPRQQPQKSASEQMIDKRYSELVETRVVKLSEQTEQSEHLNSTGEITINFDTLKSLKKFTNKDWFKLSKEDCRKILDEAHIDYSHIEPEKWELVKFIKSLIKDIE